MTRPTTATRHPGALCFKKSSTRTHCAFEVAAHDQGAHVTCLGPEGSHIGRESDEQWAARIPLLLPYRVTEEVMLGSGWSDTGFLHCLPSVHDRSTRLGARLFDQHGLDGAEVTDEVFESPHSLVFDQGEAQRLAQLHGWAVAADGERWRRVVPSPQPQRIIEQDSVTHLLEHHAVVICGGGGGAPVTADRAGLLTGVEAVVDKDAIAALLACALGGDRLLVATAGNAAAIGSLTEADAVLDGTAGTTLTEALDMRVRDLPEILNPTRIGSTDR